MRAESLPKERVDRDDVHAAPTASGPTAEPGFGRASHGRTALFYLALTGAVVGAWFLIRAIGLGLTAPPPAAVVESARPAASAHGSLLAHVLLALLVITLAARATGWLFQRLHQPPVIGEIIAGILLGPSLLGRIAPGASQALLPASVTPFLGAWSQIGAILFMFLVGLHLDARELKRHAHTTIAISHAGILVPFLLGTILSLFLYPLVSTSDVPFTSFSLFIGVAMSITAFPVLARILTDRNAHTTPVGRIALACAAVDDLTAWCLLAFVVSLVQSQASGGILTIVMALAFVGVMVFVGKRVMRHVACTTEKRGVLTQGTAAFVLLAVVACAAATDAIGVHALFGAFFLGVIVPHDSLLAKSLIHKLQDFVVILFLPAYFAYTGLRTEIALVSTAQQWMLCGLIVLVASIGKFGGVSLASRLTGLPWRTSAALGILMNTRGLMQLVVLNIGYDLGLISPTLFAMMVFMALVTTLATTPVFDALTRNSPLVMPVREEKRTVSA